MTNLEISVIYAVQKPFNFEIWRIKFKISNLDSYKFRGPK